jgi:hypothetical protein
MKAWEHGGMEAWRRGGGEAGRQGGREAGRQGGRGAGKRSLLTVYNCQMRHRDGHKNGLSYG